MSQTMVFSTIFLYTDPGTGAMLWQLSAAAFVGLAFYFRHYVSRIKVVFTAMKNKKR
jgi:hypothetical protein